MLGDFDSLGVREVTAAWLLGCPGSAPAGMGMQLSDRRRGHRRGTEIPRELPGASHRCRDN